MNEDLMRPVRDPDGNNRLILAVGRVVLTAVQEELKDRIREDRKRLREAKQQAREKAKQELIGRVVVVPPKPRALQESKLTERGSKPSPSGEEVFFQKEEKSMSNGNMPGVDRDLAGNYMDRSQEWRDGFVTGPKEEIQIDGETIFFWKFEFLPSLSWGPSKGLLEQYLNSGQRIDLTSPFSEDGKEWGGHFLQKFARRIQYCHERRDYRSQVQRVYRGYDTSLHRLESLPDAVLKKMFRCIACGVEESDPRPDESEMPRREQYI